MASFGNPDTKNFSKTHLRNATYGETTVTVHALIWKAVERIFQELEQNDIPVAGATELDDVLKLGFHLETNAEVVPQIIQPYGFYYDDGAFRYGGDADSADKQAKALIEAEGPLADTEDIEPEPTTEPLPERYSGNLEVGDEGDFVRFIQYLVGADASGLFDEETSSRLRTWQARRGIQVTGVVDENTWTAIVPARVTWMRPGATGENVKVMQAAMKARGYYDQPISGVWGLWMSRALRQLQADYGIHARLRIGPPEYEALFNPPPRV